MGASHAVQKHHRVKIARSLLHTYGEEGDEMLQRIVAIDETWIRSFEPELKRQVVNGIQKIHRDH